MRRRVEFSVVASSFLAVQLLVAVALGQSQPAAAPATASPPQGEPVAPAEPAAQPQGYPQPAPAQQGYGQPPAPQQGYAQPGYQQPYGYGSPTGYGEPPPPPPPVEDPNRLPKFALAPHLGVLFAGSGQFEETCDGDCSGILLYPDEDYDHNPAALLSLDFLFRVTRVLRLGPGLSYGANASVDLDATGQEYTLGSEIGINFLLELAFAVGEGTWLVPRGQLGLLFLLPSGDLEDGLDAEYQSCRANPAISGCDSLEGARTGFDFGLGFGAMFAVGESVRLRADLLYQWYIINVMAMEATGTALDTRVEINLSGGRAFLMGGVEF